MKVILRWYEPIEYWKRNSRTPQFDRWFPFGMSALASFLFFASAAKESGKILRWQVVVSLLIFGGCSILFSWLFPYLLRAEIRLLEGGVRRIVGGAQPGQYSPYQLIERCRFSPGADASYILLNLQLRNGYSVPPQQPAPLRQTAVPAKMLTRVQEILREAQVVIEHQSKA